MKQRRLLLALSATVGLFCGIGRIEAVSAGDPEDATTGPDQSWLNRSDTFPIAVWLQSPSNAARYKSLGINVYVALWRGPTEEQLTELKKHGIRVVCSQNKYGLENLDDETIIAWMHGDEPDNAQSLGRGKGYGPPIEPERIVEDYQRLKQRDASRPILMNLGQGVAWDGWHGRGVRTNHPEDYPEYVRGCDIASFDIYPAVHSREAVAGKLWYVALGVDRLRTWTDGKKPVWNCIECTRISNPDTKPTPQQVKAEVWMSIIHGSQGLIYFCHQFQPQFIEAGLLADAEMAQAVGGINSQIHELASVIRSPVVDEGLSVACDPPRVSDELAKAMQTMPVAFTVRKHRNASYVFGVRMEEGPAKATFRFDESLTGKTIEVLGERRSITPQGNQFVDDFGPYEVHLYKIH